MKIHNSADDAREIPDVTVVVDIHSQLIAPLDIAALIASVRKTRLRGLCVEDPDLRLVAGLPFTQEVTFPGGHIRTLEDRQLRLAMSSFASRFERLLSERAKRSSLPWSISTVTGRKQALEMSEPEHSSLLVIAQPGKAPTATHRPVRILLLANQSTAILPALDIVLQHNLNRGADILLLTDDRTGSELTTLTEHVQQFSSTQARAVSSQEVARLCHNSASPLEYVIASRQGDDAILTQVMRLAACPILLVDQ